jgi:hypothetical protein
MSESASGGEPEETEGEETTRALVETGADLAGALAGGGVGLIGGPLGALGGAAIGVAVARTAKALGERLWGRERVRAGAALALIAEDARQHDSHGDRPRQDGFFDARDGLRPEGEELLEGVLRQAAAAWEERKVPLIAQLYSEVAYDDSIAPADATFLVRLAGELTWRQFVALAVFAHHDDHMRDLARAFGEQQEVISSVAPDPAVLLELNDLGDRRLIGVRDKGRVTSFGEGQIGGVAPQTVEWSRLRLTSAGELLAATTGATEISQADREAWIQSLRLPIEL